MLYLCAPKSSYADLERFTFRGENEKYLIINTNFMMREKGVKLYDTNKI